LHRFIQRVLAGMAERRVAKIVRERNRLNEIFADAQVTGDRARNLCHFERVRQTRAKQVAFVIDEDLGLVFEPAKCGRMHDAVAIALKLRSAQRGRLVVAATARARCVRRVRRQWGFTGSRHT
jgi:hypothetical protein